MSVHTKLKTWYVYLLCDPDTEVPFYVGKGKGDRAFHHERNVNYYQETNEEKKKVIRQILDRGKRVLVKVIAEFDDEGSAYIFEWGLRYVATFSETLTNCSSGAILRYAARGDQGIYRVFRRWDGKLIYNDVTPTCVPGPHKFFSIREKFRQMDKKIGSK